MTSIKKFGFDENEPIFVINSEGTFEASAMEFTSEGVYSERAGIGRNFIPWNDVVRIYQPESMELMSEQGPDTAPA